MAAPAIAAVAKKVAVYVLTDKKLLKIVIGIVLGIIVIILMPLGVILGLFSGSIDINTDRVIEIMNENTSALTDKWSAIETELSNSGLGYEGIDEAKALYTFVLYKFSDDAEFTEKLAGCFADGQTDEELIANVNTVFGTNIKVEDFTDMLESTREGYTDTANYLQLGENIYAIKSG